MFQCFGISVTRSGSPAHRNTGPLKHRTTELPSYRTTEAPAVNKVDSFRDLEVYKAAFALQHDIFGLSKGWSKDETFALTGQIRRSSRSIGSNLAESWAKRRYPAHFLSKLTNADGEAQETFHWIAVALDCGYISQETRDDLESRLVSIGKMLGMMMKRHESFCF